MLIHNAILTGSISLNGSDVSNITGSAEYSASFSSRITNTEATGSTLTSASSSFSTRTTTLEGASGSFSTRTTSLEAASGSFSSRTTAIERVYATTGSNYFNGQQVITGSLYVSANLIVQGSSSLQNITASAVSIGTNTVILNTAAPAVRFAGISVTDSGSNSAVTSSIWYDSLNNRWIYQNESGSTYSGGMLISGPRNTGSLGDEVGITNGYIAKGLGGDHIGPSVMFETGSNIGIGTTSPVSTLDVNGRISLGGALFTNVAQTESGTGTLASGYNFNLNNGSPVHQATGTMAGVWFNAGTVQWYTNSSQTANTSATERMRITNAGNVGIGTTSPRVVGTGYKGIEMYHTSGVGIWLSSYSDAYNGYLSVDSGGTSLVSITAIPLVLGTSNAERMRITSAGNVLVGGTSDSTSKKFQVFGDSYIEKASGNASLLFQRVTNDTKFEISVQEDKTRIRSWSTANDRMLSFETDNVGTQRLVILGTGNVGIGTASPTGTYGKLSVAGGISILNDNSAKLEIGRYSSGAANSYIKLGSSSNSLRVTNNDDSADIFTITNGGNVGINDTSPAFPLDVNGNTRTQGTTMLGSNVGLLQYAMDGTRFNAYGYSVVHIKTSISKAGDTMISYNIRGFMYSPQTLDTDVAFYCYSATSSPYGVTISHKAYSGFTIGMYYSSDNYVCIYVDGLGTYGGFALNWTNTSLIQWGGRVYAQAWTKANTTAAQY